MFKPAAINVPAVLLKAPRQVVDVLGEPMSCFTDPRPQISKDLGSPNGVSGGTQRFDVGPHNSELLPDVHHFCGVERS